MWRLFELVMHTGLMSRKILFIVKVYECEISKFKKELLNLDFIFFFVTIYNYFLVIKLQVFQV